LARKLTE